MQCQLWSPAFSPRFGVVCHLRLRFFGILGEELRSLCNFLGLFVFVPRIDRSRGVLVLCVGMRIDCRFFHLLVVLITICELRGLGKALECFVTSLSSLEISSRSLRLVRCFCFCFYFIVFHGNGVFWASMDFRLVFGS